MSKCFPVAFAVGLIVLGGCSSKVTPNCNRQPDPTNLDSGEQAALADAMRRYGGRCEQELWQCDISVARTRAGEILVTVGSVYPDADSGHCLRAPGDQDLAVYTLDGHFVREVLTL